VHLKRSPAKVQREPFHQQLVLGKNRVAGVARFAVAWSTPDRSDAVMRQVTVLEFATDEEVVSFLVDSGLRGSTTHAAARFTWVSTPQCSRDCEDPRPAKSVLEPEEPPAGIFTPRHLGLVLPREDSYPAQERQATGHFAARVDPYRAVDDLHVANCHPCAQDFVEREHCEELLAQIGFGQPTAAVLPRYVREHAGASRASKRCRARSTTEPSSLTNSGGAA
jgi:hypothetical protein